MEHSKSILQQEKCCMACKTTRNLERHHCFLAARRKTSEKWGLWVWLCHDHHTGRNGVHFNREFMEELQEYAQTVFEGLYGYEEFMQEFGKNYKRGDAVDE